MEVDRAKHDNGSGRQSPPGDQKLRLVGAHGEDIPSSSARRQPPPTTTISDHADPRWVLALRTTEAMQGPILPPQRRERLIRMGQTFGLSTFDANVIIAVVQDQARRGLPTNQCAAAGVHQLARVPHPAERQAQQRGLAGLRPWRIAWWCAALLFGELLLAYLLVQ